MTIKSTSGRFAGRFRGGPIFPNLMFRPNQGMFPFMGRRRFNVGGVLARRFQPAKVYGRLGCLEVRLARKRGEIRRAQRLRYKVFYEEMSAGPDALAHLSPRDAEAFETVVDPLLVIDRSDPTDGRRWRRSKVVGTYRVLRQEVADLYDGFYTQGEYDIAPLIQAKPDYSFMELGRSCVLKPYRNKRTLELLGQGVWSYVREHGVDVMIGCASFEGIDPTKHAEALSFLYHTALAPEEWRGAGPYHPRAGTDLCPPGAESAASLDQRLSTRGRLCRRWRRERPPVRHDGRVHHHAGRGDQVALLCPFRRPRRVRASHRARVCPGQLEGELDGSRGRS